MKRKLNIAVDDLIELISCASDYGFENDILFDAFSEMLNKILTNEEIETYARSIEALEGYGKEDYVVIKDTLNNYRNKYCIKEKL